MNNDLPKIIRNPKIAERIHFAHLRNIKYENKDLFHEVSHLSSDGNLDMYEIVKALIDTGFDGCIRPDPWTYDLGRAGKTGIRFV